MSDSGDLSFWRIFHSLLRESIDSEEVDRAKSACQWMVDNVTQLRRVCLGHELPVLNTILDFWLSHAEAPSFDIIQDTLQTKPNSDKLAVFLDDYEILQGDLKRHQAMDLNQLLLDKTEAFHQEKVGYLLEKAQRINTGRVEDMKGVEQAGPDAALKYVINELQKGVLTTSRKTEGGILQDSADQLREDYENNKLARSSGTHIIRTGLPELDSTISIKKGHFVGVLGFAKSRKTSFCRSMVYNAAVEGFSTLHISLEQTAEEERVAYTILHAKNGPWFNSPLVKGISQKRFENGLLTSAEETLLFDKVLPDMEKSIPGKIIIRQPTEGTSLPIILSMAQSIYQTTPFDILFLDYLTLVQIPNTRNRTEDMNQNIIESKRIAMNFQGDKKVLFLTPIQGNRDGQKECVTKEGVWDISGIRMYSEFERSLDLCIGVFYDENLSPGKVRVSVPAVRRAKIPPNFDAAVEPDSGYVHTSIADDITPERDSQETSILMDNA